MNNFDDRENANPLLEGVSKIIKETVKAVATEINRVEMEQSRDLKITNAVLIDNPTWKDKEERNDMIRKENECKGTTRRTQTDIAKRYSTKADPLKQPDVSKIALGKANNK